MDSEEDSLKRTQSWVNLDVPRTPDGRTFHLGLKNGQLMSRVLTVGDKHRAERIAQHLENKTEMIESSRGFTTISGTFEGVRVSIVAIGMGTPMMDFFVREGRAVVSELPMVILRYGTCGVLKADVKVGTCIIANASCIVQQNPDSIEEGGERYRISKPIPASEVMTKQLISSFEGTLDYVVGTDCTADSFYSSQGRVGTHFDDANEHFVQTIIERVPNATSMQMETGQLFHLSRLSRGEIAAGACCIGVAHRIDNSVISVAALEAMEIQGGLCALKALTKAAF